MAGQQGRSPNLEDCMNDDLIDRKYDIRIGHIITLLRLINKVNEQVEEILEEEDLDLEKWGNLIKQVKWMVNWAEAAEGGL
jgi:hypothetical protein